MQRKRLGPALLEFSAFQTHNYYKPHDHFLWNKSNCSHEYFLSKLYDEIQKLFTIHWGNHHKCKIPGCGTCAVFDANHKCKAPTCANPDCVTPLDFFGLYSINIGCSNQPSSRSHLCSACYEKYRDQLVLVSRTGGSGNGNKNSKSNDTPTISKEANSNDNNSNDSNCNNTNSSNSNDITIISKQKQENENDLINEYNEHDLPQDKYLMERILKHDGGKTLKTRKYLIKWLGHPSSANSWEPAKNIPRKWTKKFDANPNSPLQVWTSNDTKTLENTSNDDISEEKSQIECNTDKEKAKKDDRPFVKQKRMIGVGTVCWPCGIIFYVGLFYRSESIMQWIRHLCLIVMWCNWLTDITKQGLSLIYDDGCHLHQVLTNPKRIANHERKATENPKNNILQLAHKVWMWLSKRKIKLDRVHAANHKEACVSKFGIKTSDTEYKCVNTEVCESLYRWLSAFKHIVCNMTQLHMKWFVLNLCHQRNIEVEKALKHVKAQ